MRFYLDDGQAMAQGLENLRHCYSIFEDGAISACAVLNKAMISTVVSLFDEIEREIDERRKSWYDAVESNLALLLINIERYIEAPSKQARQALPRSGAWCLPRQSW